VAHEVIWLAPAADELDEIAAYIAKDSPRYAAIVVERILSAAQKLADFPGMGGIVPLWNDHDYRQIIIYSYRLIYRVRTARVEILTVHHGARLLPDSIRRRTT
jgi:addiction module RelE/StbE family toxin